MEDDDANAGLEDGHDLRLDLRGERRHVVGVVDELFVLAVGVLDWSAGWWGMSAVRLRGQGAVDAEGVVDFCCATKRCERVQRRHRIVAAGHIVTRLHVRE
jgi:hypothetical protein